jgi:hydrogenase maturation protease
MAVWRLLGLGNEILADDAFGIRVAREAARLLPPGQVEVVSTSESGLHLLDYVLDVRRLVVVDTVETGAANPGALSVLKEGDFQAAAAGAAHGVGLLDALALARRLGLPAAEEVVIIAVEAADCSTIGGPMSPAVEAAIPRALHLLLPVLE